MGIKEYKTYAEAVGVRKRDELTCYDREKEVFYNHKLKHKPRAFGFA